jgi:hypothetical protein
MMKCKCGHDKSEHSVLTDESEVACMVKLPPVDEFTNYCPCMNYDPDETSQLAALLAAGNALNKALGILCGECIVCDASGELGEQVTGEAMDAASAALAAWEKVTK